MRKINPISKTAQTTSKNTSIDMKKASSSGMQMQNRMAAGGAGPSQTQQMHSQANKNNHHGNNTGSVYSQQSNVYHQGNAQIQAPKILGGPHGNGYESHVYSKTSQ